MEKPLLYLNLLLLFSLLFTQEKAQDNATKELKTKAQQLYSQGINHYQKSEFEKALPYFQQTHKIMEKLKNPIGSAATLSWMAFVYLEQEEFELAVQAHQRAFLIYEKLDRTSEIAGSLNNMGIVYKRQEKYNKALEYFLQALEIRRKLEEPSGIATVLNNIGIVYENQKEYEKALLSHQEALKLRRELNNAEEVIVSLNYIGNIYLEQDKFEKAIKYYQEFLELEDQSEEYDIEIFENIGFAYFRLGKYKTALEYYKQALKLNQDFGEKTDVADLLEKIGLVYEKQGVLNRALNYLEKALEIREQLGLTHDVAFSLHNIGLVYWGQGKLKEALDYYQRSLKVHKQHKDSKAIAGILNNIGAVYSDMGNLGKALENYQRALQIKEKVGNTDSVADTLNNIAMVYQTQGKNEKALKLFLQILELRKQVGHPGRIANTLNQLGTIYSLGSKTQEKALDYFLRSLEYSKKVNSLSDLIIAQNNIGGIYNEKKQYKKALKYSQQALENSKKFENPNYLADSFEGIGYIYHSQGEPKKAIKYYLKTLKNREKSPNPTLMITTSFNLAKAYEQQGSNEEAKFYYLKGIKNIEFVASQSGMGREDFLKKNLKNYYFAIDFFQNFEAETAFTLMQQCKAFGFLTGLAEMRLELEKYANPQLIEEKKELNNRISFLNTKIIELMAKEGKRAFPKIKELKKSLVLSEKQLADVIEKIRFGNPAFGNVQYPKSATLREIQDYLQPDELLLEFYCLAANKQEGIIGNSFCFVIGSDIFEVVSLGKTQKLSFLINNFRSLILETQEGDESNIDEYYEEATKLYNILLKPLLKLSKNKINHLFIAPDASLNFLAFDALCFPGQKEINSYQELPYLLDQYKISYTMSATVLLEANQLSALTKRKEKISFFGFGDPSFNFKKDNEKLPANQRRGFQRLPNTRKEVIAISKLFPANSQKILLDQEANEPNLFLEEKLSHYQILHFATHGLLDQENPLRSSILLSQLNSETQHKFAARLKAKNYNEISCSDGFLQVRDIFNLHNKINPQLVVLSACETGLGKLKKGNGLIGLSRAWQFAGSPSIVVSLWAVNDKSTSFLMRAFYQNLLAEKSSRLAGKKLTSLHQAKKILRHSKNYNAPYFWAPFILRGLP